MNDKGGRRVWGSKFAKAVQKLGAMQIDGREVSGTEEVRHVAGITPFHTEVLGDTTPSGALLDILRNTMPRHRGLTIQRTILPRTPPSAISQLHQPNPLARA